MKAIVRLALAVGVLAPVGASAATVSEGAPDTLRLRVDSPLLGGRITSVATGRGYIAGRDTLAFIPRGRMEPIRIPFSAIRSVDVWSERGGHRGALGGLIGVFVGGSVGYVVGGSRGDDDPDSGCFLCFTSKDKAEFGMFVGALAGAGVGVAIGRSVTGPGWVPTGPEWLGDAVAPPPAGAQVRLSTRF